ncbi:MAG TPA: oxygenase MpaB family protein [Thermoleophilaceae bacterium]|nr:oxygenase MpaB family protein [Thermoleophilaceae bacterium]
MERDDGLLGPDSVAWRVIGHPVSLVGGLRSLIVQALHPLAMAGVAQHSDYRRRPLDRLRRTSHYVAATTFGNRETALAAAAHVRRIHKRVRGIDPVTGKPYSADDPDTQLWVHCVEWHSFLAAYRAYATARLTPAAEDRYIAEGAPIAALLGVPEESVPQSVAEMRDYFAAVRPRLCVSDSTRDAIGFVLNPPLTRDLLPLQVPLRITAAAAVAIVPHDLRRLAGIGQPRLVDGLLRAAVPPAAAALQLPLLRDAPSLVLGAESRALGERARRLLSEAA